MSNSIAIRKLLILIEKIFIIISFIHCSGGPLLVFFTNGYSEGEFPDTTPEVPLIVNILSATYVVIFVLLLLRWKKVISIVLKSWLFWILLGLAISSVFWSSLPDLTRTRVIALTGTMMFSLYLASRYSLKEQLHLFGWIFGIIVVTSYFLAIVLPFYGIMGNLHAGAWRGIYNHKNVLGKIMVPSILVFLLLALTAAKQKWIFWTMLAGSVGLLILSKSSSPLVNLIILLLVFVMLHVIRWNYLVMIPVLIAISSVVLVLYSLFIANAEQIVGGFGKSLTLTGRTDFWPLMLDMIWKKPLFGYGFGAFWRELEGPSAAIWHASSFKMPNGHNGYLDLCLELGFVGLSIYLVNFIVSVKKAIVYARTGKTADAFWPILFLFYIVLSNLTESSLIIQNNFLWTMQVSMFFSLYSLPSIRSRKLVLKQE